MNFLALQNHILAYIHRPASEMRERVITEINLAKRSIERLHEFKYAERLVRIVYPANTLTLTLTGACEGSLRNLLSAQLLANADATNGQVLKTVTYNSLIQEKLKFEFGQHPNAERTYAEAINSHSAYKLFLMSNAIGLYPTPTSDVNLLLNLSIWLPDLAEDEDTNFFLEFAEDLMIDKTLDRLSVFLKDDARLSVTKAQIAEGLEALFQWDSQIRLVTE